jgi:hypothetical protein
MSLILTWDHPLEMTQLAHTAVVLRAPGTICGQDVTWGMFEDRETNDESTVYTVNYLDRGNNPFHVVADADIRRFVRPANTARITFDQRLGDGGPAAGRWVEMSDEPTGNTMTRRITLNSRGRGAILAKHGTRLLFRSEGSFTALDVVIPSFDTIGFDDLTPFGSIVDADKRGWY